MIVASCSLESFGDMFLDEVMELGKHVQAVE